jgi:hypothetical protein
MSSTVRALSSSIIALNTLQNDAATQTKGAHGEGHPLLRSPDPRSAYTISVSVANVLMSFSDKTGERTLDPSPTDYKTDTPSQNANSSAVVFRNVHSSDADILQLKLQSFSRHPDSDIKALSSDLPKYLARQIESHKASDFATQPKIHLDDESLVRLARNNVLGIYEIATTDQKARDWVARHMSHSGPYDPNDAKAQAVLNGTARIVRGPELLKARDISHNRTIYGRDPVTGIVEDIGTTTWSETNPKRVENDKAFVEDFERKNPGLTVYTVHLYDDVALVIYPIAPNAPNAKPIASQPIR